MNSPTDLSRSQGLAPKFNVMAGLGPAIHAGAAPTDVDARVEPGHDGMGGKVLP